MSTPQDAPEPEWTPTQEEADRIGYGLIELVTDRANELRAAHDEEAA